jgi:disulfide bond formation protein DsbB
MVRTLTKHNPSLAALLFLASLVPLAAAYTSEYGFGLKPCELCILQRIPFFITLGFSLIFLLITPLQKYTSYLLLLSVTAFLANSGIAFYHMGVEFKWWQYGSCSAALDNNSFDAFKASIMNAPNVRCDEPQFKFLGVTMAGWNFALNIIYTIFFTILFSMKVKHDKNK